jgi:adenylosuccinate synthase
VAYEHDGHRRTTVPADPDTLAACKPVYVTKPGWKCDISQARKLEDLPSQARDYLKTIAELLDCPIDVVSVGPDQSQTIQVKR